VSEGDAESVERYLKVEQGLLSLRNYTLQQFSILESQVSRKEKKVSNKDGIRKGRIWGHLAGLYNVLAWYEI